MLYDDTQYFIGVFVACMRYKYVVRSYYDATADCIHVRLNMHTSFWRDKVKGQSTICIDGWWLIVLLGL